MTLVFALLSASVLLVMDYLLAVAVFLGRPAAGEIFVVVMLICIVATALLRRRWMVYATQNLVSLLLFWHVLRWGPPEDATETATLLFPLVAGNLLAWVIARAMPGRGTRG